MGVGEFIPVGPEDFLWKFLDEFGLSRDELGELVTSREIRGPPGAQVQVEWLVHRSLLRSQGEFPCAADTDALEFCREIASLMQKQFGISKEEAVARINRQWSEPLHDGGVNPRTWIIGLDVVYHEEAEHWASDIYFGHDSCWWLPGAQPTPLPPPA